MVAKYGSAGMRQLSRRAAKGRVPGDRTIPSNAELLATAEGRKRAAAIARELGINVGPRGLAQAFSLETKEPVGAATLTGSNITTEISR